jgi:cyclin B
MGRSTKRSREDETEKKQEAKKPKRSSSNAIGNKAGRDRERSAPRGSRKKQEPPRKPCAEFLTDSSYSLVPATTPFDSSKFTLGIAPHDQEKKDDVNEVSDYTTDIFQRLYHAEGEYRPKMYMDEQDEITPAMRAILVDWLVEVHMKFRLVPPTLYLCVNIIDRFCAKNNVERRKLQLVGVTALLVACKYEEIYPPEVRDCVYITDRAYTRQEVLDMEQDIVRSLEFKMTVPTAYPFLARFLHLTKASELTSFAANYYLERCLQEYDLLKYRPSLVAATAVCLALNNSDIRTEEGATGKFPGIPRKLLDYTGFDVTEMQECGTLMVKKIRNGETVTGYNRRNLVTVKQKFESRKYRHISDEYEGPTMDHMHG